MAIKLSGDSYLLFNRLGYHNKITFTITTSNNWDKFGVSFVRGTDSEKYYSLVVNPENEQTRKINFEEEGSAGRGFINGIDGYNFARPTDNVYHVTIYTDNSIAVMYINDVLLLYLTVFTKYRRTVGVSIIMEVISPSVISL